MSSTPQRPIRMSGCPGAPKRPTKGSLRLHGAIANPLFPRVKRILSFNTVFERQFILVDTYCEMIRKSFKSGASRESVEARPRAIYKLREMGYDVAESNTDKYMICLLADGIIQRVIYERQ